MKKSLLQILLGVIIGGAAVVVLGCLSFLHNAVSNGIDTPKKSDTIVSTPNSTSTEPDYFAKVHALYRADAVHEGKELTWLGVREDANGMEEQGTLQLWAFRKLDLTPEPIAEFTLKRACDSADWQYLPERDEVVVTRTQSWCEGGSTTEFTVFSGNAMPQFRAEHGDYGSTIFIGSGGESYDKWIDMKTAQDCSEFTHKGDPDEWKNPPKINLTGLTVTANIFDAKSNKLVRKSRTLVFSKPVSVNCETPDTMGSDEEANYLPPGFTDLTYESGLFVFSLPDNTKASFDPAKLYDLVMDPNLSAAEGGLVVEGHSLK